MNNDANNNKIENIASIGAGYALRGAASKLVKGDIGLIQLRNVSFGTQIHWEDIGRVSLPTTRKVEYLDEGDVIFAARGTQNFAYHIPKTDFKCVCAPQFFVLKITRPEIILPEFLAWYLNSKTAQNYFESVAVGTAMKNIRRSAVEKLALPTPPVSAQRSMINIWNAAIAEERTLASLIKNRKKLLDGLAQDLSTQGAS